jgi:hypothetical protein
MLVVFGSAAASAHIWIQKSYILVWSYVSIWLVGKYHELIFDQLVWHILHMSYQFLSCDHGNVSALCTLCFGHLPISCCSAMFLHVAFDCLLYSLAGLLMSYPLLAQSEY